MNPGVEPRTYPYPPVGMIAVTKRGERIAVWADEGDDPDCFTGQLLSQYSNDARARVHDVSTFWLRAVIHHTEAPTEEDKRLSLMPLEPGA